MLEEDFTQNNRPEKVESERTEAEIKDPAFAEAISLARAMKNRPAGKNGKFKSLLLLGIFLICAATFAIGKIEISEDDFFLHKIPFFGQIAHLVKSSDRTLKGEEQGKTNILFLGMGGLGHEGGLLTDTIILASLDQENKKVALLSIPRDLSIPVEDSSDWTKINNINAFAEVNKKGSGGLAISQAVSDILETPIDYYVRVDFAGFVNIIDRLGGIEIDVKNSFDDYSYPIAGREEDLDYYSRFEHLHFDAGWQKMDGKTALKFARSRHGDNGEGSDFARARRQQAILQAAKNQLLKAQNILNPVTLTGIISDLNERVSTNLKIWEIIKLWSNFKNITEDDIIAKVIDDGPSGLLYSDRNADGAYILKPKNGDFSEIKYLLQNIFSKNYAVDKEIITPEKAAIEVKNGTWINGLAQRAALDLEKSGFIINNIGNSSRQNFQKSVIYDLTFGEKIKSLTILKEKTDATATFELPDWLKEEIAAEIVANPDLQRPDFILVLGQDADKTNSGAENKE